MGNIENKNQINSQETTNKAREKTEAGINSVDKTKLANNISTQWTKWPENKDIKEVWKDTDLVKDKIPDLWEYNMKIILVQYKLLWWDRNQWWALGFDTLKLGDLYKLPATTKANIAYLSSMLNHKSSVYEAISKTSFMKENNFDAQKIWDTLTKISKWATLSSTDLAFTKAFRTELEKIQNTEILQKYTNMFPAGADVPPMPDIMQLAIGDGQSTWWIGWTDNGWRWLFDYNESYMAINQKNLQFWVDHSKPMSISVIPSWAKWLGRNMIKFDIKSPIWTVCTISWRYSASATRNNMEWSYNWNLNGIVIDGNTISIPNSYKDSSISVRAFAAEIRNKDFDEANFSLSIDNGRTLDANRQPVGWPESYTEKMTDPMKLGEFELTDLAKNTINSIVDKSLYFGNKTLKKNINLNLTIAADATAFDSRWIKWTIVNYQNFIAKQKNILVNQLKVFDGKKLDAILSKLQPDDNWKANPDQYRAQKALLDCRFLTTVNQIIQNKDMVNAIKTGKFTIVANSASDGKYIKLEPDAMNYAKPLTAAK